MSHNLPRIHRTSSSTLLVDLPFIDLFLYGSSVWGGMHGRESESESESESGRVRELAFVLAFILALRVRECENECKNEASVSTRASETAGEKMTEGGGDAPHAREQAGETKRRWR